MIPKSKRYINRLRTNPASDYYSRPLAKNRSITLFAMIILTAGLILTGCGKTERSTELVIGAASSLTEPLNELSSLYETRTGIHLQISFASSGTLRKQAEEGAPFDLLILASSSDFNALSEAGLLVDHTKRDLLSNQICLVSTNLVDPVTLESLPELLENAERVTLGDPSSVPVGRYALDALETLGLATLIEEKQLYAKDARQVLQYLNTGAVDTGFLFATDAALLEGEFSILVLPDNTHKPILYPAATLTESGQQADSEAFLDFLSGEEAVAVFKSYGFSIPR